MKKVSTKLIKVTLVLVLVMLNVNTVNASGDQDTNKKVTEKEVCVTQYGGGTECKTEVITEEEVVHETVEAGLEDFNFIGFAGMLTGMGALFLILSKATRKVYLLD